MLLFLSIYCPASLNFRWFDKFNHSDAGLSILCRISEFRTTVFRLKNFQKKLKVTRLLSIYPFTRVSGILFMLTVKEISVIFYLTITSVYRLICVLR